jgi:hypothetical protein
MTVAPVPRGLDLNALIEEARRRARRRRMALAAAILAAAALGVGSFELTRGSDPLPAAPPGFVAVKARGAVAHAVIEYASTVRITSLTGQDRPGNTTEEIWYDARGGLWRDVVHVDGRLRSDQAARCPVSQRKQPCLSGSFTLLRPDLRWVSQARFRSTGTGRYHGAPVVWLESKSLNQPREEVALNAKTHELVVDRTIWHGRVERKISVTRRPTLPAARFSFLLRQDAEHGLPIFSEPRAGDLVAWKLPAARRALGRTPLWLGPRFHGLVPLSVQTGTYPAGITSTGALQPAPFVRIYYGPAATGVSRLAVDEFGSIRPFFYRQGPRPGLIERDVDFGPGIGSVARLRLVRDGLLLRVFMAPPTRAQAISFAKALRPLPPGLESLPRR